MTMQYEVGLIIYDREKNTTISHRYAAENRYDSREEAEAVGAERAALLKTWLTGAMFAALEVTVDVREAEA